MPDQPTPEQLHADFCALLDAYGNVTALAKIGGITRRALFYKRSGESPVTPWDVAALERLLFKRNAEAIQAEIDRIQTGLDRLQELLTRPV